MFHENYYMMFRCGHYYTYKFIASMWSNDWLSSLSAVVTGIVTHGTEFELVYR